MSLFDWLKAVSEGYISCLYMRFVCHHRNMQSTQRRVMDDVSQALVMRYSHYLVFNLSAFRGFMFTVERHTISTLQSRATTALRL